MELLLLSGAFLDTDPYRLPVRMDRRKYVSKFAEYCLLLKIQAAAAFNSEAIAQEYSHTNVRFQTLMPFLVATKLARYESAQVVIILITNLSNLLNDLINLSVWHGHSLSLNVCSSSR